MKFEGEITEIELLPKLVELSEEHFTGALRFENDAIIKIVYFKAGEVLSASTNDRADSIDEILLRSNKVSKEHIKQALAKRKDNETLGDALLSLGFITRKELTWARRAQVIGILRSLVRWTEGSYTLVSDYLPKREEGTSFHLPQLIVELLVTDEDRGRIEQVMQGGEAIFEVIPDGEEKYRRLGLNEDADAILSRVDGVKNAGELAQGSTMDTFSVFKLLEAFYVLGITRPTSGSAATLQMALPPQPEPNEALEVSFDDAEFIPPPSSRGAALSLDVSEPPEAEPEAMPSWEPPSLDLRVDEPLKFDEPPTRTLASTPIPPPPGAKGSHKTSVLTPTPSRQRSKVPLVAGLVLLLLAAAGYAAWKYLLPGRTEPTPVATIKKPRPVPAATAPAIVTETTGSLAPATETTDTATAPLAATDTAVVNPVLQPPIQQPPVQPPPVAVTTPRPASSTSDPVRAKYEAMARDFAAQSGTTAYAVQVAYVCEASSLTTAVKEGTNIWFVPAEKSGRVCFRVLWGRYQDRSAASRAIPTVPQAYRQGRPVVVKVSQVVSR